MYVGVEDLYDDVCVHQSHGAAGSAGTLAGPLDGEVAAKASADYLRNQLQVPGCTLSALSFSVTALALGFQTSCRLPPVAEF